MSRIEQIFFTDNHVRQFYAELEPDARGFTTFMTVDIVNGKIVNARIDAINSEDNPYGLYKTTSEKYNNDMFAESGTYYRDAAELLERDILRGVRPLNKVDGARFLSQDANELICFLEKNLKSRSILK